MYIYIRMFSLIITVMSEYDCLYSKFIIYMICVRIC